MWESSAVSSIVSISDPDTSVDWILLGGGLLLNPATYTYASNILCDCHCWAENGQSSRSYLVAVVMGGLFPPIDGVEEGWIHWTFIMMTLISSVSVSS